MFLQKTIETDNSITYIFHKNATDVSPVRAVAEAILEFGDDPAGVPSSAINFAIAGHPHSGGQRFREICQAYRRQWLGMDELDFRCTHLFSKNRYIFNDHFLDWLRANLPDIERIVAPVVSRIKFKDNDNENPKP